MKKIGIALSLTGMAFGGTLAVLVGMRLSAESLSVVTGLACGVSILGPMLLVLKLLEQRTERQLTYPVRADRPQPSVIVVSPPFHGLASRSSWPQARYAQADPDWTVNHQPRFARQFNIIGTDGEEIIDGYHDLG
jgi:hypothetical protein